MNEYAGVLSVNTLRAPKAGMNRLSEKPSLSFRPVLLPVKIAQFHQFGLEGIDLVHHMPTVEGPGVAIIQGNHVPGIFRRRTKT